MAEMRGGTLAVALAFLLSGAAALVDQVGWQRILVLHTGVGVHSVAIIVAVFMAGLGLGSYAGGRLSAGFSPRVCLLGFGALELLIAGYAAASPWLLYDLLYRRASALYSELWLGGVLHFLVLLVPTTAMGMSLPFLVRATVRSGARAPRTIGVLYGVNTLGAAAGALVAPWLLLPRLGLRGALLLGAATSAVAGVIAIAFARVSRSPRHAPAAPSEGASGTREPGVPFGLWLALYGVSGLCAIGLEVMWFRVVEVATKATTFAFGTVLAVYLGGLGAGSLVGSLWAPRLQRPLRAFLLCQGGLLLLAGASLLLLATLPVDWPLYSSFVEYWAQPLGLRPGRGASSWGLVQHYAALPVLLLAAPTALMGLSFTALQRAVQDEPRSSGRKVGYLQAANIAGCVCGSLLVGLVGLELLGTMGTLWGLLLLGAAVVSLGAVRLRDPGLAALAASLVGLGFALPNNGAFWSRLHGSASPLPLLAEDATGVIALAPMNEAGAQRLFNNGWSHSSIPFGAHTPFGAIPAVVHPAPRDVAIIGLGSGDTAWAAGLREATERVRIFEIRAGQEPLLRQLARLEDFPSLRRFLADPRMLLEVQDGRFALAREGTLYDVIETDPLHPDSAGAGNLYSLEFYELCARRLKPGGLVCVWAPTGRVTDTFRRVFATTLLFPDVALLIGSRERLSPDHEAWRARLLSPQARAYLDPWPPERLLEHTKKVLVLGPTPRRPLRAPNLDLFPRDEFELRF